MAETRTCPECGAQLPADAPQAPCPACLMKLGLQSWAHRNSIEATIDSPGPAGSSQGFLPPKPAELERLFPHLEILDLVGHGGMGAVYKARQKSLDRLVALKIIKPNAAHDPGFAGRFTREARALARLNHPHIVTVFDYGETPAGGLTGTSGSDKLYFFIMEYVEGANLRHLMESKALGASQALAIVPQVCEALQVAHDQGIVHRDVKPENILVDAHGRVKIADFGLAKLLGKDATADHSLTGTHQVMGTPRYMAPEQMEGTKSVDHRADIYSLGVVFYELLTGELPLGRFAPPSSKAQIDARIDEIVLRTLEKEVERRYQRASEIKSDVESVSESSGRGPQDRNSDKSLRAGQQVHQTVANLKNLSTSDTKPNYGLLAMGGVMLLLGLALLIASRMPGADVFLWTGIGLALGGGGCFAAAWQADHRLPLEAKCNPGLLAMGGVMLLIGGALLVFGASNNQFGKFTLVWIGIGLSIGGGGCFAAAWQGDDEEEDEDEQAPDAKAPPQTVARKPLGEVELADARRKVQGPAVGLIMTGVIDLLPPVLGILAILAFYDFDSTSQPPVRGAFRLLSPSNIGLMSFTPAVSVIGTAVLAQAGSPAKETVAIVWVLVGILAVAAVPLGVLLIVAGLKMRQTELYGLAVVASFLALLPCHAGWIAGFPAGLWSLLVLARPEVKAAFADRPHKASI